MSGHELVGWRAPLGVHNPPEAVHFLAVLRFVSSPWRDRRCDWETCS